MHLSFLCNGRVRYVRTPALHSPSRRAPLLRTDRKKRTLLRPGLLVDSVARRRHMSKLEARFHTYTHRSHHACMHRSKLRRRTNERKRVVVRWVFNFFFSTASRCNAIAIASCSFGLSCVFRFPLRQRGNNTRGHTHTCTLFFSEPTREEEHTTITVRH